LGVFMLFTIQAGALLLLRQMSAKAYQALVLLLGRVMKKMGLCQVLA